MEEKEVRCTPEELKELIENLEEGQILEVTFDAEKRIGRCAGKVGHG